MTFWKSLPGMIVLILLLALAAACGVVTVLVWGVTHPPRVARDEGSIALTLAGVELVAFKSSDGLDLSAWLFQGQPGHPAVVLAHDAESSKDALVNLAIVLQKRGLTVLAFDFRGHGGSQQATSTLGVKEKRDVLGAVDYLASLPEIDHRRVGLYGVGMGAHAGVLAAADRPALRVLVLDGMYPDVNYVLVRRVYDGWSFGVRNLGLLPELALKAIGGADVGRARAADILPGLQGRELLLVAPEGNPALSAALKRLYESLPQRRDAESNLISVPAVERETRAGEALARYYERVADFLVSRVAHGGSQIVRRER